MLHVQRWLIDIGTTIKIFLRPISFLRFVERLKTCSCRQKFCITQFHTSYSCAYFKWEDILRHRGILMHLADTYIVAGTQLRINCYANATTFLDEVCSLQMFTKVLPREKRDRRADKTFGAIMTPLLPTPLWVPLIHFCLCAFIQHSPAVGSSVNVLFWCET